MNRFILALSRDGFYWHDLNGGKPVLRSGIGEKGVRDPFLLRSQDGDRYYVIATDLRIASGKSWEDAQLHGSHSIIVWESEDLLCWSEARSCELAIDGAGCVWAPEAVYSLEKKRIWFSGPLFQEENSGFTGLIRKIFGHLKTRRFTWNKRMM